MLKISSHNERLNNRLAQKEATRFFYKFFLCVFLLPNKIQAYKKGEKQDLSKKTTKNFMLSKRYLFLAHLHRYGVNWQSKLAFGSPFTKTQTICFLTGRSRSIYRAFRLSRLKIREYGAAGHFVGLSKASW